MIGKNKEDIMQINTEEQTKIINHKEGPAYVVAGAGTGKTYTMTSRVQALVESGIRPESILVLTFTNAAANEMKKRLKKNIGAAADQITACTYHSFCNILMHRYGIPSYNFTILDTSSDEDLVRLVKVNSPYADTKLPRASSLKDIFSKHVNCNISIHDIMLMPKYIEYEKYTQEIEKLDALVRKYRLDHNMVNYDDMLEYCDQILSSNKRYSIFQQYQYILVDEAQDTNYIQFKITGYLSRNIMYIGDPEQSIYGFRGSNIDMYLSVPKLFQNTEVYTLSKNYRCTQQILDVANSIIKDDDIPYKALLETGKNFYGEKPKLALLEDQDSEAEDILENIRNTNPDETTAVIYRNSAMSAKLELLLVQNKMEYTKKGGTKFFEMGCIRDMMALFKLMVNPHDCLSWFRILQKNRFIGDKRANQIVGDGLDPINSNPFRTQKTKTATEICRQLDTLDKLLHAAKDKEFTEQTEMAKEYYLDLLKHNLDMLEKKKNIKEETIDNAKQAITSAKTYVPVLLTLTRDFTKAQDFLDDITLDLSATPESISAIGEANEDQKTDKPATIVLTTIHSAKGLEWDHVYIMDAVDGIFPQTNRGLFHSDEEYRKSIDEERRCMYVAVTRARNSLTIYCPEHVSLYGKYTKGAVSQFLVQAERDQLFQIIREDTSCPDQEAQMSSNPFL